MAGERGRGQVVAMILVPRRPGILEHWKTGGIYLLSMICDL